MPPRWRQIARLQSNLAPADMQTRHVLGIPIGETRHRLHSYFSLFGPDHGLALVASAQAWAAAPFIRDAGLSDLPLLSAAAPCKFGARSGPNAYTDVPQGPVTLRHVAALNMFTDEVRLLHVTFADVLDWLEMSASLLHRVHPGRTGQVLVPEDVAGYNFDVIHGVTYQIDPTQPARYRPDGTMIDPENRRVRNLMYQGAPVDLGAQCLVATNSYRCGGGGRFQMAMTAPRVPMSALEVHEAIRAYVAAAPDGQGYAPPWRLTAAMGTIVEVQTGPPAAEVLGEIDWLCPEDLGLAKDGFRHIRLHF